MCLPIIAIEKCASSSLDFVRVASVGYQLTIKQKLFRECGLQSYRYRLLIYISSYIPLKLIYLCSSFENLPLIKIADADRLAASAWDFITPILITYLKFDYSYVYLTMKAFLTPFHLGFIAVYIYGLVIDLDVVVDVVRLRSPEYEWY